MKKTLFFLLLISTTAQVSGQITVLRPHAPTRAYSNPQTNIATPAGNCAERRAAALTKVQWTAAKTSKSLTAKGLRPAEYSTDAPRPVEYSIAPNPSTTMTVNGLNVQRNVRKGFGQVGNELFTPVSELFFVQFAVYCKDTPVDKAPPIDGLLLLWHEGSQCPGGEEGASHIVKGYGTPAEAKAAVLQFKSSRIDCWFNPTLTGAEVEVIGVR